MREPVDPSVWTDTEADQYKEGIYAVRDKVKIAEYLKQAEGKQVLFTMNCGGDNTPALKEIMKIMRGEEPGLTIFDGLDYIQLGIIWMMDPALDK